MILDQNILMGVLAVAVLALTLDVFLLRRKIGKMLGKGESDLGQAILGIRGDIAAADKFRTEMEEYLKGVEKRLRRSLQAAETVRFNAFRGEGLGGNQSFASAFLSEEGDGAVISSLYSRDRVSIFAKPVSRFDSEISLSEEESRAVSTARAKLGAKA